MAAEPERTARRSKSKRRKKDRQGQGGPSGGSDHSGQYDSCEECSGDDSSGSEDSSESKEISEDSGDLEEISEHVGVSKENSVVGEQQQSFEGLVWQGHVQPLASFQCEDLEVESSSESDSDSTISSGSNSASDNDRSDYSSDDGDTSKSDDSDDSDTSKSDDSDDSDTSESEDSDVEDIESISKIVKLYEGSEHGRDEAILKVLELFKDPSMTKNLLKKTVSLVYNLLPKPNLFPPSYYFLKKYLDEIAPASNPAKHYYCRKCQFYQGLARLPICTVCGDDKANTFHMFSVNDCIKNLFEIRRLAKVLSDSVKDGSLICDITDGLEYAKAWKDFNKKATDLTLLWNTDGIQLSESSNIDLWPIQFTICEVPRDLREYYIVVCGIYVSEKKNNMNTFLRPFALEIKEIFEKGGVKWIDPDSGEERSSMVLAPVCSLDAPARADGVCMTHHMGEYPCSRCERRGKMIRTRKKGHKRVFPPKNRPSRYRTAKRMLKHAYKATLKKPFKGMKGPSYVHVIPKFDAPKAVIAESLHNTFSGVARLFVKTMFTDCNGPWYLKARMPAIDRFLLSVKLPKFLTRSSRGIKDWTNFKAHENMTWVFYLSLPALKGFLDDEYLDHWMLLVRGIYLLHKDQISQSDLKEAESLLKSFHDEIKDLYKFTDKDGVIHDIWLYHFNVHQLLHQAEYAAGWGPSWSTSAFVFESNNGFLKNLVHGYSSVGTELANSLQILESIRTLKYKCQERKPSVIDGKDDENDCINGRGAPVAKITDIVGECEKQLLLSAGLVFKNMSLYQRITGSRDEVFTSKLYTREKRRNNYTVQFVCRQSLKYGEIEYYLQNPTGEIFCLIRVFKIDNSKMFVNSSKKVVVRHIIPVTEGQEIELVQFNKSISKVVRVGDYVCVPPNNIRKRL